jgi:hypothetical protein
MSGVGDKPPAAEVSHMTGAVAYCSLLAIGLGAYFGLSWIIMLLGALVLAMLAVLEQRPYRPRLAAIGMDNLLHTTGMASNC